MMTSAEFTQHIRFALQHLYEMSILEKGPAYALAPWLDQISAPTDTLSPGQRLHRLLVSAIEQMKPPETLNPNLPRHRSYLILKRRYLDGIAIQQLESEFSASSRQFRRESHRAIEELVLTLWNLSPHSARPPSDLERSEASPVGAAPSQDVSVSAVDSPLAGFDRSVSAVNLLELVVDAAQTLSVIISNAQIQVVADIPPDLPLVAADRVALRLALIKLLRASIAHTPEHALRLHAQPQADVIRLTVEGVVRIDAGDSTFKEATQLFALAGGNLEMVTLETDARPVQQLVAVLPVHRLPAVLVVDDDPAMPRIIQRYLALQPIRVVNCDSTADVVKLAREVQPVLILLDVLMPKRDGWEILQALKAHPDTYHIQLAVCSIWDERELALLLGADLFFQKPIDRAELLACVESHVGMHKA